MTTTNKTAVEERVWVFVELRNEVPYFSKLFTDHTGMKEFSAKHSRNIEGYSSVYYELTDKTLLQQAQQQGEQIGYKKSMDFLRKETDSFCKGKNKSSEVRMLILDAKKAGEQIGVEREREQWIEANDLLRSLNSVVQREGKETNWEPLKKHCKSELERQHTLLKPIRLQAIQDRREPLVGKE